MGERQEPEQDYKQEYKNLNCKTQNGKAIIEIYDNGGGVSKDIIDKVFEPYFTTKHQSRGTGLGLYMVYKIITESFKGTISVLNINFEFDNKKQKGAKFEIQIPIV